MTDPILTPEVYGPDDLGAAKAAIRTPHGGYPQDLTDGLPEFQDDDFLARSPFPGLTTHPTWVHRLFALLGDALGVAVIFGLLWLALAVLT